MVPLLAQTVQPKISFDKNLHEFGKFKEADGKVTHKFEFVNTGGSDLVIQNVTASCGCTASRWTREPVPPGGKDMWQPPIILPADRELSGNM